MTDGPRSLMLNEFPGRWNYADPPEEFRHTSGVQAWTFALQGDYWGGKPPPPEHLRSYDLVVANLFPTCVADLSRLAATRPDGVRWVSLIEGPAEWYLDEQPHLREVLDASDLVATINRNTVDFFQAITKAPVANIGIPYPVKYMRSLSAPIADRRREVLLCPRTGRVPSIAVARQTGLTIRAHAPKVSRTPRNLTRFVKAGQISRDLDLRRLRAQLPEGSILSFNTPGEPYFREVAGCLLWINLDPRYTWARFVLDAAALGVPIVSTESTGHAPELFPKTTVRDAFQVSEAVAIAHKLIEDGALYAEVVQYAASKLDAFDYEPKARDLLSALHVSETRR